MASYRCRHCSANNPHQGRCVMCQKPLGNLRKACLGALGSASVMALIWAGVSVSFGIQHPVFAAFFGGIVSLCTTHFSGGRGILYQLIATTFTVLGLVVSEVLISCLLMHFHGDLNMFTISGEQLLQAIKWKFVSDDASTIFYVLGLLGGFYIWRE